MRLIQLAILFVLAAPTFAQNLIVDPFRFGGGGSGLTPVPWITDVSSIGAFDLHSDSTDERGAYITPAANLTISALGRYKVSGNNQTHSIKVYTGLGTLIDSATVDMTSGSAGQFVYADKTIVLYVGNTYFIQSTEVNGGDQWHLNAGLDATTSGFLSAFAGCVDFTPGTANRCHVPINFKATIEGSPLMTETFEGTGYSAGSWTESGSPDEDFSTSGLSLDGSECLRIVAGGSDVSTRHDFTAQAEVTIDFKIRFSTLPVTGGNFLYLSDGSGVVCILEIDSGANAGRVRVYNGSAGSSLTSALSVDTTYTGRLVYKKGTGSNGRASVDFGGGITANVTSGDATTDASRIQPLMQAGMGGTVLWDTFVITR